MKFGIAAPVVGALVLTILPLCAAPQALPRPLTNGYLIDGPPSVQVLRVHERFDAGWKFYRGDDEKASQAAFNDAGWRSVQLPHDWSIEDLPGTAPNTASLSVVPGTWRFKMGDDMAWKAPTFDDAGWQEVTLPTHWSTHVTGGFTQKFGWYRRRFSVPPELKGKDLLLLLGKVDDCDETFINGVKVGGLGSFPPNYTTAWEINRRYPVPAALLKGDGTDVIAVRDYNGDGDAGIYESPTPMHRSGPFDSDSEGGTAQGYTVGGVGWYRKTFTLPAYDRGRQVGLTFDGVYMNSQVWLNGELLGTHPYGYTSFNLDATPHIRFGAPNVLSVRVDASGRTSRWYSGAGIYRHVWLNVTGPVHIAPWGVSVTTPTVSPEAAAVHAVVTVTNESAAAQDVSVTSSVIDAQGKILAAGTGTGRVPAGGSADIPEEIRLAHPTLWSPDHPAMYRLDAGVSVGGRGVDGSWTPFGVRTITIDAVNGLRINGQPLKLRGGCVHHDNGCLGSATYDRAEERRVEMLKAAGFNAIRTSHNPPSPAFLDACDRLGMVVLDEAFDCWAHGKNGQDYGRFFQDWWQRDIQSMVLRDRNHPSVAFWSIGNEIPEQNSPEAAPRGAMIADYVRKLDPTRPVGQATNPDVDKLDPLLDHLDLVGYNYASNRFARDHEKHPARVFAGTESFPQSCFDAWMAVEDHPYAIGDFVWTALDYLGEAGIGKTVPQSTPPGYHDDRLWTVSNCGDLDLNGFQRPASYYRNAVWGTGAKVSAFVMAPGPDGKPERVEGWGWPDERPSWTWPGLEGKEMPVHVYASGPQVRLVLNGKDLGTKETTRKTQFRADWTVPYEPGELDAIGLDAAGQEVARWPLRTTGTATSLDLSPDRTHLAPDGEDLSYVTVTLRDAKGAMDPNADNLVHFTLTGPGTIIGVSNADPRSTESFQQPQRTAYHGRLVVVIRSGTTTAPLLLTATAQGLKKAIAVVTVK